MPKSKDLDRFRGEVGETLVAYELMKLGWAVMKNLGGVGYDLSATKRTVTRHIEVKATDPALKTGKTPRQLTHKLSKTEGEIADFFIYYIHGHDAYYIIPRRAFPASRSVTVYIDKNGKLGSGGAYEQFRDKWDLLD